MTKTENDIEQQATRQELKKEIMAEMKHDARRKKVVHCLGCFALELLVIAIPVVFVAVMLAKTGLVNVPLLTSWLYRPNYPSRQVQPLVGSNAAEILIAQATRPKVNPNFGTMTVSFSEAQLTTIAQEGLTAAGSSLPLPMKSLQIAIDADSLELYGVSPQNGRDVTIMAKIVPSVDGGELKIDVKELKIGALDVPASASQMLTPLLDRSLGQTLVKSISQVGQLVGISFEKGIIRFDIVPKKTSP